MDYPLYHSSYENFDAMKRFLDPDFSHHLALGRMWGWMGVAMADSALLPLDVGGTAKALHLFASELRQKFGTHLNKNSISLGIDELNYYFVIDQTIIIANFN